MTEGKARSLGSMATACDIAAKWQAPKSMRPSEVEDIRLTLRQAAELLAELRPHAAAIRDMIGRQK